MLARIRSPLLNYTKHAQRAGLKTLDFGGTMEDVIERTDYPADKLKSMLGDDTMSMLGYGTQGRGQVRFHWRTVAGHGVMQCAEGLENESRVRAWLSLMASR